MTAEEIAERADQLEDKYLKAEIAKMLAEKEAEAKAGFEPPGPRTRAFMQAMAARGIEGDDFIAHCVAFALDQAIKLNSDHLVSIELKAAFDRYGRA